MASPENVTAENEKSLQTLARAIRLSQGEFSLILLRCNYASLKNKILQKIHRISSVPIYEITLPVAVKTLYTAILEELKAEKPNVLMVFGLESVKDLDLVLTSANHVREEFRKNFPFPLLLWVNDQVLQKLIKLATDFENWATVIEFKSSVQELKQFLHQKVNDIFIGKIIPNSEICWQLKTALRDLASWEQEHDPIVTAGLEFVVGLNDFLHNQIEAALKHYQQSLEFWQQQIKTAQKDQEISQDSANRVQHLLERQGIVLLHIALAYCRKAEQNQLENNSYWKEAQNYFQQSFQSFEQAKRPDLIAQHIIQLGEVLRHLEAWDDLQCLANKALKLHHKYGSPSQIAQDYGFLAEIALAQSQWRESSQLAQKALRILANISQASSHYLGKYRFILALSQQKLEQVSDAIISLERARNECNPQCDPHIYIQILESLRSLYFENSQYLKAFRLKQEKIAIEYQYGLRAFIGATYLHPQHHSIINTAQIQASKQAIVTQEIAASGRQEDVNRLLERISRNDHKLTIIHGQSGVGKSSLLKAGLIPSLKHKPIGGRDALPIFLRVYRDWIGILGSCLTENLNPKSKMPLNSIVAIVKQLQKNAERSLLTILIFDQFEELFVDPNQNRREFYNFFRLCLNIPFLKIVLSLREDYLHYLLEFERLINLDAINNNILDKNIRYYLGNFTDKDAKAVIETLTERTHFCLEMPLIDKLVQDLADDLGEIRPIELQIVGAQLQTEKITTLDKYQQLGTKEKLVERFLEAAIQDCGPSNERTARLVLYLLTEENNIRPLKTLNELVADLEALDIIVELQSLELVLIVLVGAGLVFFVPEAPAARYQLIHDYLVSFIRQQQAPALLAELTAAKEQQKQTQEQLKQTLKQLEKALHQEQKERKRAEVAEIEALISLSQALFLSHNQLEALLAAIKALRQLQEVESEPSMTQKSVDRIREIVSEVQEHNRLDGHENWITSVNFSPDRERIASASADRTIKIWSTDGYLLRSISAHRGIIWEVVFSPNGKFMASVSDDATVKLWTSEGKLFKTLQGHSDQVFSVAFSPNAHLIASASADKSIKLWSWNGKLLNSFCGHNEQVLSVSFSPDGKIIASASTDKTVKLWGQNCEDWSQETSLLKTLEGHSSGVHNVTFSPDGRIIASASTDGTIKLWSPSGTLLKTLQGHTSSVNCVRFSPDSRIIASASTDNTVKLWSKNGQFLGELRGHTSSVNYVSFSPDGKTIASSSGDKTIKLWNRQGIKLQTLEIDELLAQGCHWLQDYLKTNPYVDKSDRLLFSFK